MLKRTDLHGASHRNPAITVEFIAALAIERPFHAGRVASAKQRRRVRVAHGQARWRFVQAQRSPQVVSSVAADLARRRLPNQASSLEMRIFP
jgi:hypothetical protein